LSAPLEDLRGRARELGLRVGPGLDHLPEDDAARVALAALSEAGLVPWTVPAAYGGADTGGLCAPDDVSVRALCAVRAELAYHSGMLDVMFVMQGLGSYPVARGAGGGLAAELLPRVAAGAAIAAFAVTEPGAGSSLGEVATRAERRGDSWSLSGVKTYISNAGLADFYSLLARTGGEPGDSGQDPTAGALTMFCVPAAAPGLRVERFEVLAPHPIGELHLDGVLLDDSRRLGAVGGGLPLALATLGRFRASVAAAACGAARRALDESRQHLSRRRQFGRPLSSFQALRFDLAEMDVRLRASELLTDEAASALDAGRAATAEVARAKLFATESAGYICDRAVQHLGGLGVRRGAVVERLFREVRALRIYEGTSEIQRLILAKELLEGTSPN
jgi:acyl-CoA dehydrogenase